MKDVEDMFNKDSDFMGKMIRLGFHECGTFQPPHTSGPDGCILRSYSVNSALLDYVDKLNKLRNTKYQTISRADLWAFVTTYTIDLASVDSGEPLNLIHEYRWGRKDRDSCEKDLDKLPNPEGNVQHVMDVFKTRLGFESDEIVALIGGHTVGKFDGKYGLDTTPLIFDNQYFKDLLELKWIRTNFGSNFKLWKSCENTRLFHTDLLLAYNVGEITDSCEINTGKNPCSIDANNFETRKWVKKFSNNQKAFFRTFAKAWKKLFAFGYSEKDLHPILNESNKVYVVQE